MSIIIKEEKFSYQKELTLLVEMLGERVKGREERIGARKHS